MSKKKEIELEVQETIVEEPAIQKDARQEKVAVQKAEPATKDETAPKEEPTLKEEAADMKEQARKTIQRIKEQAKEEDPKLTSTVTLRTILGGDFLTAAMVRHHIWLLMLIVLFAIVSVAFRYQCQQDIIAIDKLEKEVLDSKYKALSSSSTLTEKCRESHVLEALKQNKDSLLHIADQPPYIINVPE